MEQKKTTKIFVTHTQSGREKRRDTAEHAFFFTPSEWMEMTSKLD